MTAAYLHEQLIKACKNANVEEVKQWLDAGAEPNFNIKAPINALDTAIQMDNHELINLLLERGATLKEFVIQKAIEKDKNYLNLLIPNFKACTDTKLLMGILQAAININDLELAQQAIAQGAKPELLFISSILDIGSTEILQLLIENGFNIHADKNIILTQWMGATLISGWGNRKHERHDLLSFIANYYLEKPKSLENFKSLRLPDKSLLFRLGLNSSNLNVMKFAFLIGAEKNKSLNSALHQYYVNKEEKVSHAIIEYILNSDMKFKPITISNAVCFNYTLLLNALNTEHDLTYAYEMAFKYENDDLLNYFARQGVTREAQLFAKMRVSALKGNIKALHQAINEGAKVKTLHTDVIVEIINENQVASLKTLTNAGLSFDTSLNAYLDNAMRYHKAYESIAYLIELGLDITSVKNLPVDYKKKYPIIADMWAKRFSNIFNYTMYLVKEVHPQVEGKEKEEILKRVAELSSLPYVLKMSKEKALED